MFAPTPSRPPARPGRAALAVAVPLLALSPAGPARASDGLLDDVLRTLNLKAAPPAPAPDFIERSRPDAGSLGYLPTASPHKVSAVPVRTPAQIQAQKDALDAAQRRQLNPGASSPAQLAAGRRSAAKPASAH